jgi:hypothetical protein
MPAAAMKRIIVHWTAGPHTANAVDRAAYHILVEESGKLVRGTHTIADNVSTADGNYAAHTYHANTRSIGVSMCCMKGCVEKPFSAGSFPMSERQWQTMLHVVAQLCRRYEIDVTPQTVLGHGEVQKNLGIAQKQKWDPMVLPWNKTLSREQVGNMLRQGVREILEPPVAISVNVAGATIGEDHALIQDGRVFVDVGALEGLGWKVHSVDGDEASVEPEDGRRMSTFAIDRDGRPFISVEELADDLERTTTWDSLSRTIHIS